MCKDSWWQSKTPRNWKFRSPKNEYEFTNIISMYLSGTQLLPKGQCPSTGVRGAVCWVGAMGELGVAHQNHYMSSLFLRSLSEGFLEAVAVM